MNEMVSVVDNVAQIHPLFNLSWQAASALYRVVSYQLKKDAKLLEMVNRMMAAFKFMGAASSLEDRTGVLKPTIKDMLNEAISCSRFVQDYASHVFVRVFHWGDEGRIGSCMGHFRDLRKDFDTALTSTIANGVGAIVTQRSLQLLLELDNMDASRISTRPRCHMGTRKGYLDRIEKCLLSDTGHNITWLTGAAGKGKSTIAITVVDRCGEKGNPAAYLFFERNKEYSSAIRVIAFKLATLHPTIAHHIENAAKRNKDISGKELKIQFEKLLLEPLRAAKDALEQRIFIVVDALDESGSRYRRRSLIQLLIDDFAKLLPNVRVLITSRPEGDIVDRLKSSQFMNHITLDDEVDKGQHDAQLYLFDELKKEVGESPSDLADDAVRVLSDAADGFFIWASTAAKMVAISPNRRHKLRALLNDIRSVGRGGIDHLYSTVLRESSIEWNDPNTTGAFTKILGLVLFAKESMTGEVIETFLNFSKGTADLILGHLHSVLVYEAGKPVRLLHTSFADYLTSTSSRDEQWKVDERGQKLAITERCFDIMAAELRFNICDIGTSFLRNDDIPGLQSRIVSRSKFPITWTNLLKKLKAFAENHLLYWLEVLSLSKHYSRTASKALYEVSQCVSSLDSELSSFLWSAYRLASTFAHPISQSAPHIYPSVVSLWKSGSPVAEHYAKTHPIVQVHQSGAEIRGHCIMTLETQAGWVNSISCCRKGKLIASGSSQGTIYVWDADNGELVLGPLKVHSDAVISVSFSPDGNRIVSGSVHGTIHICDATNGTPICATFKGHTGGVASVSFPPDGKRIASGSWDAAIRIWGADSGELICGPLEGHGGGVWSIAFSSTGNHVVSGSEDGTIHVWDAGNGKSVHGPLSGHEGPIYSVAYSPNDRHIASGSYDHKIRIWDAATGKAAGDPFEGHSELIWPVSFSPGGERLVSGSMDSTIRIWNVNTGEMTSGPFGRSEEIRSVAFLSDEKRVASRAVDGTVRVWDADGILPVPHSIVGHTGTVESASSPLDGKRIVSGSRDCTLCIWEVETGKLISGPLKGHTGLIRSVAFCPSGKLLASGSVGSTVRIWDADNGRSIFDLRMGDGACIYSVAFSPIGELVGSGSSCGTIGVWESNSGQSVMLRIDAHDSRILSVTFSSEPEHLLSSSYDGTIRVWNIQSGQIVTGLFIFDAEFSKVKPVLDTDTSKLIKRPANGHTEVIWSVGFSSDGMRAASGSFDATVRIWDISSGGLVLGPLKGHTQNVVSIAFSSDGRYVASASRDNTIRVWDVNNGSLIYVFKLDVSPDLPEFLMQPSRSIPFSPSGKYIASCSVDNTDKTFRIWEILANSNSTKTKKHSAISEWALVGDGWACDPGGELLTWVPPDMRRTLCRFQNIAVLNCEFSTRLDFENSPLGEDWYRGFPSA